MARTLPRQPALYQINTRVWLTELSRSAGRRATLDDIPDSELRRLAAAGFDWVWLLSVWQTGPAARAVSRTHPEWRAEFAATLPDLTDEDIAGSGFAIRDYAVHRDLGGAAALARLRRRMAAHGLRLMLDFVPNHVAPDHAWVEEHPDHFVRGAEADLQRDPRNWCRVATQRGPLVLAHGRDPFFDGWPDTLQLDYGNPGLQRAMIGELQRIAGQCDGVRCDMAMLLLPDVFERTWGIRAQAFWPQALEAVRRAVPGFTFMAEVYWDREWELQQQGFDVTYDKRLYDRLRDGRARPVREHLLADPAYQARMARFLENHDEPRAAATFPGPRHAAAAVITFLTPGLRFLHQGQLAGKTRRISPHLVRAPEEPVDLALEAFYAKLLAVLRRPVVREGEWRLLECVPAWEGNGTWDDYLVFTWRGAGDAPLLVAVNHASHRSQCRVRLPAPGPDDGRWLLRDLLGDACHVREGRELQAEGLYLDEPAWSAQVFELTRLA